jgi:hypothetical protein
MELALPATAGNRVQFGPSTDERGHSPAAVTAAWLMAVPASHHGHDDGASAQPASAAACQAAVSFNALGWPVTGQRREDVVSNPRGTRETGSVILLLRLSNRRPATRWPSRRKLRLRKGRIRDVRRIRSSPKFIA